MNELLQFQETFKPEVGQLNIRIDLFDQNQGDNTIDFKKI